LLVATGLLLHVGGLLSYILIFTNLCDAQRGIESREIEREQREKLVVVVVVVFSSSSF
jgi:hypothetical protein